MGKNKETNRYVRNDGVGTFGLVAIIMVVFIVGASSGVILYSHLGGSPRSGVTSSRDNQRLSFLSSKLENLEDEIDSLKESLENREVWNVSEIYQEVRPSVVKISVAKREETLFGTTKDWGYGSGFVYNGENGLILTNAHVVSGGNEIYVRFYNGDTTGAQIVGTDRRTDIAVLKVNLDEVGFDLKALELENSEKLEAGERVIAIGSPFGLSGTITAGIISHLNRTLTPSQTGLNYPVVGLIQTDVVINPGSSGGPLLTFDGEVVGINSYIQSVNRQYSGIGYAICSNLVKKVASGLVKQGVYYHPWMGISGERRFEEPEGVEVLKIFDGSPADNSKLKEGDVITRIDGQRVVSITEVYSYLVIHKRPGDEVTLRVVRGGEEMTISLTLGRRN